MTAQLAQGSLDTTDSVTREAVLRVMLLQEMCELDWPHIAKFYQIEEKQEDDAE